MNQVNLIGRLAKDPEIRYTQEGTAWGSFTLAVDNNDKEKTASFITCKTFRQTAEVMEKWGMKGRLIGVSGHIKTGSYEKDGHKVFTMDVIVDRVEFLDKVEKHEQLAIKPEEPKKAEEAPKIPEGFSQITDEDIPF